MNKYQEALFYVMTHLDTKGGQNYEEISKALHILAELVEEKTKDEENSERV